MSTTFWGLALLWLPVGVVASAVARMGPGVVFDIPAAELPMAAASLAVVAPCGLPLALGCRKLWHLGRRRTASVTGGVLGFVTVAATVFAGLLGPIAIVVYAAVLSLPVWLLVWLLDSSGSFGAISRRGRARPHPPKNRQEGR